MPYQSITAPRVTFEELEKERNDLSVAERTALYSRTRGFDAIPRETKEGLALERQQLEQALDTVDPKEDYNKALRVCQKVVETEANPLFFLRCCQYDPQAAAKRMVEYWKFRVEIFGADKAFCSLTQKGGALREQDLVFLQRGAVRLQGKDRAGRWVLYFRRALVKQGQGLSMLRCMMYIHAVICRDINDQRHGMIWITDTKYFSLEDHDRKLTRQFIRYQLMMSPVRIHGVHVAFHTNRSFGAWIAPVLIALVPSNYRRIMHCYTKIRPEEFVDELEQFGISADLLTPTMGGSNGLEQFQERVNEWMSKEGESS